MRATSLGARHQIIVLGDRQRDAGDVGFLKRIGADQLAAHLAGNADDRRGIQHRGGDAGNHIGRARAGGRNGHANFSAGARVSVRHVGRALLMPHQNVMDVAVLQSVISRQNRAAGISEDVLHAFALQALPKNARAGHCFLLFFFSFHAFLASQKTKPTGIAPWVGSELLI